MPAQSVYKDGVGRFWFVGASCDSGATVDAQQPRGADLNISSFAKGSVAYVDARNHKNT